MNPPYSDLVNWCQKAYEYALAGGTVIALLPVWSDTGWFHSHVRYGEITFLRGKLSYVGRAGYAWFPSMVVMWSSETVRRKATDPLLARLDNKGLARGGRYIAAQISGDEVEPPHRDFHRSSALSCCFPSCAFRHRSHPRIADCCPCRVQYPFHSRYQR
jgi:hypothetical protein